MRRDEGAARRWEANGFLPRMPDSLEHLDLLLIKVVKSAPGARWCEGDGRVTEVDRSSTFIGPDRVPLSKT